MKHIRSKAAVSLSTFALATMVLGYHGFVSAGAAIYYLHNDHLGTPRVVTDQQRDVRWRADYMPFGETIIQVVFSNNNLLFSECNSSSRP